MSAGPPPLLLLPLLHLFPLPPIRYALFRATECFQALAHQPLAHSFHHNGGVSPLSSHLASRHCFCLFCPSLSRLFSCKYELPNLQVFCFDNDATVPGGGYPLVSRRLAADTPP